MMRFTGILSKDTPLYMPEAWELLRAAAERNGNYTQESVRAALLKSEWQLWCVFVGERMVAAAITETAMYPAGMRCAVLLCGGTDMHDWLHPCLAAIEAWAAETGCTRMRIEGRPGWAKALPDYEWRSVVLTKELGNG